MNQQHFDNLVREKLAALETMPDANGWDMFAQKLTAAEDNTATSASIGAFDQIFQNKIGDISATEMANSWDTFEQKLSGSEAGTPVLDETELDEIVYNKLYNYQVPYEAATWNLLLSRLRKETWQRFEIGIYKIAELSLLLLLFLFGQQFMTKPKVQSLPIHTQQEQPIAEQRVASANDVKEENEVVVITQNSKTAPDNKIDKKVNNAANSKKGNKAVNKVNNTTSTSEVINDTPISSTITKVEPQTTIENITSPSTPIAVEIPSTSSNNTVLSETSVNNEVLPALENEIAEVNDENIEELAPVNLLTPDKKKALRFGIFSTGMIDHITTPEDLVFNLDGYDRYSAGYGGGFSIGKQLNSKLEIETGLMYVAKRYPQQVVLHIFNGNVKDGYGVTWVSDIEMNIINIPLNIRYNILSNNKWNMYGLGGVSLQLLLQANYDSNIESLQFSSAPPSGEKASRAPESESRLYQRKRFNNGFLVDGEFKENRYFNYNVGIGLERFVSPRWSIFAQPTYQHTIKAFNDEGIGPNRDRINTMLILLGAKVGL